MKKKLLKIFLWTVSIVLILVLAVYIAFQVSPWPSVLIIRKAFDDGSVKTNEALQKYVLSGISVISNEHYDTSDQDAFLDIYYPSEIDSSGKTYPVIVWIHGGAWISGRKDDFSNYYKILPAKGYVVISVDYSLAPSVTYPTPVRQVMAALLYIKKNAKRLRIDLSKLFIAGDSAGSHIAAQTANIICVPSYAELVGIKPSLTKEELRGLILYCGPYDVENINLEGSFGSFLKTVLWSYSGTKDFQNNTEFKSASVINYITSDFPPMFISVGNDDGLKNNSYHLARKAAELGVYVDNLFFPDDYVPKLQHEYQFNLDTEEGKLALDRSLMFLAVVQTRKQN
jgi:acetyl esterase/lipase